MWVCVESRKGASGCKKVEGQSRTSVPDDRHFARFYGPAMLPIIIIASSPFVHHILHFPRLTPVSRILLGPACLAPLPSPSPLPGLVLSPASATRLPRSLERSILIRFSFLDARCWLVSIHSIRPTCLLVHRVDRFPTILIFGRPSTSRSRQTPRSPSSKHLWAISTERSSQQGSRSVIHLLPSSEPGVT